MNAPTSLQLQVVELTQLLEEAGDDPILAPQLKQRLELVQAELKQKMSQPGLLFPIVYPVLPRAAIFLRGGGVQNSDGIQPSLAADCLINYEKMFLEQALHDERVAAGKQGRQRRPKGAVKPQVLFTGTPRGSFGLEFVPQVTTDSLVAIHADSLQNVASAIVRVTDSEGESLDDVLRTIPPRVLQPLRSLLSAIAQHGAELRLAFHDSTAKVVSANRIAKVAARLEKDVSQIQLQVRGIFRGVTLDSGTFDVKTESDEVITGTAADELTEDDLVRIDALTNKPCVVAVEKTIVQRVGGSPSTTYVLLNAVAASEG